MTTAAELARTHAEVFVHPRPWTEAEFAALLHSPGVVLTGTAQAFVLGRIVLDEAEVLTVATAPDVQRQGRAVAAMAAFEDDLPPSVISVFLEVAEDNAPARALYDRLGFAQVGRRPRYYTRTNGHPVDALILRKTLPGAARDRPIP